MPTYCARPDLLALIPGLAIDDPAATDVLIERAERDLDAYLGGPAPLAGGVRFLPELLTAGQAERLKRATAWQFVYRLEQLTTFDLDQPEFLSGPDFTRRGKVSRIAPAAVEELAGTGLSRRWLTVSPTIAILP